MKFLIPSFFSLLLLHSCQIKEKKPSSCDNELIKKFKPILQGTWIPEDYIADIVKTKSPLKSSDKLTFISEFTIDTLQLSEDSIHIGAAFGNHEGGDFILYFKQGQTTASLVTSLGVDDIEPGLYELGYTLNRHDTSLIFYHYDKKSKKLLDKTLYVRVAIKGPANEEDANGLQYMVNKKLASGVYAVIDSTGKEIKITLTDEGKITGFPGYKTYYVLTDFVADPENITDEICFDIQTKNQKCYGFKIIADTMKLFEPAKDEPDNLFIPGTSIYKFVRQH